MFGLGHTELIIILGVCVLLFGARKLPELGRGLGKGMRSFRDGIKGIDPDAQSKTDIVPADAATEAGHEA